MSNTSKKQRDFVSEPMGNKSVQALPGVGPVLGTRLEAAGFNKADNVYGKYLVLQKNSNSFEGWMKNTCNANSKQAGDAYGSVDGWHKNNS